MIQYHVSRENAQEAHRILEQIQDNWNNQIEADMMYHHLTESVARGDISTSKRVTTKRLLGMVPIKRAKKSLTLRDLVLAWVAVDENGYSEPEFVSVLPCYKLHSMYKDLKTHKGQVLSFILGIENRVLHKNTHEVYELLTNVLKYSEDNPLPVTADQLRTIHIILEDGPRSLKAQEKYIQDQLGEFGKLRTEEDVITELELAQNP